ncbi:MAG: hypothetical protein R2878_05660 [Thermoleophilia bacterium]
MRTEPSSTPCQVDLGGAGALGGLQEGHTLAHHTGRVDEDVEAAVAVEHLLHDAVAVLGEVEVALVDAHTVGPVFDEECFSGGPAPCVSRRDPRPRTHERLGDGTADAVHTTGDECDLSGQR